MRRSDNAAIGNILRAAKAKLTPDTWAQGDYAFDANGNLCRPTSTKAARFCATGAIQSLDTRPNGRTRTGARRHTLVLQAVAKLNDAAESMITFDPGLFHVAAWVNDHGDLATVHRMFDMAIEKTGGADGNQ